MAIDEDRPYAEYWCVVGKQAGVQPIDYRRMVWQQLSIPTGLERTRADHRTCTLMAKISPCTTGSWYVVSLVSGRTEGSPATDPTFQLASNRHTRAHSGDHRTMRHRRCPTCSRFSPSPRHCQFRYTWGRRRSHLMFSDLAQLTDVYGTRACRRHTLTSSWQSSFTRNIRSTIRMPTTSQASLRCSRSTQPIFGRASPHRCLTQPYRDGMRIDAIRSYVFFSHPFGSCGKRSSYAGTTGVARRRGGGRLGRGSVKRRQCGRTRRSSRRLHRAYVARCFCHCNVHGRALVSTGDTARG